MSGAGAGFVVVGLGTLAVFVSTFVLITFELLFRAFLPWFVPAILVVVFSLVYLLSPTNGIQMHLRVPLVPRYTFYSGYFHTAMLFSFLIGAALYTVQNKNNILVVTVLLSIVVTLAWSLFHSRILNIMNLWRTQWKFDVFICHEGKPNKNYAAMLEEELKRRIPEVSVFLDRSSLLGKVIDKEITTALRSTRFAVVFFSETFPAEPYPMAELAVLLERQKAEEIIIPVFFGSSLQLASEHKIQMVRDLAQIGGIRQDQNLEFDIILKTAKELELKWRKEFDSFLSQKCKTELQTQSRELDEIRRKLAVAGFMAVFFSIPALFRLLALTVHMEGRWLWLLLPCELLVIIGALVLLCLKC